MVGSLLIDDLSWQNSDIGILTGAMFWIYGIGQLVNGRLSEIFGATKFIVLGLLLSSLTNILFGFQSDVLGMALLWGINGFFQSMGWTPGMSLLAKWWPGNTHGFATGVAHAFSGFGQVWATVAVAFGLWLLPNMGWRSAFIVPPVFTLVTLTIYLLFTKSSPADVGLPEYIETDEEKAFAEKEMAELRATKGNFYPYKYILSNKKFLIWMFVAFVTGLARYGLMTWVPLYFIEVFGVNVTKGLVQSLALPVGLGIGTFVVPWLTDRYCANDRLPAVLYSAIAGTVSVLVFMVLDPSIAWEMVLITICLFVAGFSIYSINGIAWAFAIDVGGRIFTATCSGVLNFSAYMGAAVQSVFYGFLLNHGGWDIVFYSTAGWCAIIALIGVLAKRITE